MRGTRWIKNYLKRRAKRKRPKRPLRLPFSRFNLLGYPLAAGVGFFYGGKSVIEVQNYNPQFHKIDKLNQTIKSYNQRHKK